jgi:hypothetical protein
MEGYSPFLLRKIEYAGGNAPSFEQASKSLLCLGEISVSPKHIQRITERIGFERQECRDKEVEAFRNNTLRPQHAQPPVVAVLHLDAGKAQQRADDGALGVRDPHWTDTKVACAVTYRSDSEGTDPHPEPPKIFLEPPAVARLCAEMKRVRNRPETLTACADEKIHKSRNEKEPKEPRKHPRPLLKTAVATTGSTEQFGWLVAAEACRRGFYQAKHQAIIGDGGNWISPLADFHFPGWAQILDFIHALTHLYEAACSVYPTSKKRSWPLYEKWLRLAWGGRIVELLNELEDHRNRLGEAPEGSSEQDPRRILARVAAYVRANASRMDYPAYRTRGFPVTSTLVESLIKQFNQRVKGTEKFWIRGGLEAVLQVRAAYLSQDDRADALYAHRRTTRAGGGRLRRVA